MWIFLIISENGNMLWKKGVNFEHYYESVPTSSSLYWKFKNFYEHWYMEWSLYWQFFFHVCFSLWTKIHTYINTKCMLLFLYLYCKVMCMSQHISTQWWLGGFFSLYHCTMISSLKHFVIKQNLYLHQQICSTGISKWIQFLYALDKHQRSMK